MNTLNMKVRLSAEKAESVLFKGLCESFGARLTDRRSVVLDESSCLILVFSKFYKRCASLLGLTVVLTEVDGFCKITLSSSSGKKDAPLIGDLGATEEFCNEARKLLKSYMA